MQLLLRLVDWNKIAKRRIRIRIGRRSFAKIGESKYTNLRYSDQHIICLLNILQLLQLFDGDYFKHYFIDNYFAYYSRGNYSEHYFDNKLSSNNSSNVISNDILIFQSYSVSSNSDSKRENASRWWENRFKIDGWVISRRERTHSLDSSWMVVGVARPLSI